MAGSKKKIELDLKPSDDLLPCPFCGDYEMEMGVHDETIEYWIVCQCGAVMHGKDFLNREEEQELTKHERARESAIQCWNRRVENYES